MRTAASTTLAAVVVAACLPGALLSGCAPRISSQGMGSPSVPALEDTHWSLSRLADAPVAAAEVTSEPHLVLAPAEGRVTGSTGCNRMTGSYALDGAKLSFGPIASTKMACALGMDTERRFLTALSAAASWRFREGRLELLDAGGSVVAELEARR